MSIVSQDFVNWLRGLTVEEIRAEITREEETQTQRRTLLDTVIEEITEINGTIVSEQLETKYERYIRRLERIEQLERILANWNKEIQTVRDRIKGYDSIIQRLESEIDYYDRRSRSLTLSPVQRYQARDVARRLRLSIRAYRGHRTRQQTLLSNLVSLRAGDIAELAANRRWLGQEESLAERLLSLRNRLLFLRDQADNLYSAIQREDSRIELKRSILKEKTPPTIVQRVSLNYYLIIEGGEYEYPRNKDYYRYSTPRGGIRKVRQRVKYPKGKFQAIYECDAITDPETGDIQFIDPLATMDKYMRQDAADEITELFELGDPVKPEDLTIGQASTNPIEEEIGKPPLLVAVERTYDDGNDWSQSVMEYIMTTARYDQLTTHMTEYREALRDMRK